MTQADLADRCNLSQAQVSRVEAGALAWLTVEEMGRLLDALAIRMDLALHQPFVASPPLQRDAAHARCLGYAAGRLRAMGWDVRLEVEIAEGRSRGWIDLVAHHADRAALFIGEIKGGLDDMGSAQRQLGWYDRSARDVARTLGWRFDRSMAALLVLATEANDQLIAANYGLIRHAFPVRAAALHRWLVDPEIVVPRSAIALIDPRSRRRQWLLALALDGRRSRLRYATYADFMRSVRAS
jgi:transcriptional regulator with XRE-family HTH domain